VRPYAPSNGAEVSHGVALASVGNAASGLMGRAEPIRIGLTVHWHHGRTWKRSNAGETFTKCMQPTREDASARPYTPSISSVGV